MSMPGVDLFLVRLGVTLAPERRNRDCQRRLLAISITFDERKIGPQRGQNHLEQLRVVDEEGIQVELRAQYIDEILSLEMADGRTPPWQLGRRITGDKEPLRRPR